MTYYIFVTDGQINGRGCSECKAENWINVEVSKDMFDTLGEYGNDYFIYENGEIVPNPNYEAIKLQEAKAEKIALNDEIRDEALISGVVYQDIVFDSDTDQKINLLATISLIDDETSIIWFGMNNEALSCTKTDLIQIGGLITELHTFCWCKNAEIKMAISEAQTIEELEAIEINYDRDNT